MDIDSGRSDAILYTLQFERSEIQFSNCKSEPFSMQHLKNDRLFIVPPYLRRRQAAQLMRESKEQMPQFRRNPQRPEYTD